MAMDPGPYMKVLEGKALGLKAAGDVGWEVYASAIQLQTATIEGAPTSSCPS